VDHPKTYFRRKHDHTSQEINFMPSVFQGKPLTCSLLIYKRSLLLVVKNSTDGGSDSPFCIIDTHHLSFVTNALLVEEVSMCQCRLFMIFHSLFHTLVQAYSGSRTFTKSISSIIKCSLAPFHHALISLQEELFLHY
jgi:hypothetical protein